MTTWLFFYVLVLNFNSKTFLKACTMGSVTAFANPQRANKEVISIKGNNTFFETTAFFIITGLRLCLNEHSHRQQTATDQ